MLPGQSGLAQAAGHDNSGVIALHRAGLDEAVILAKVRGDGCRYDISTTALIALQQEGLGGKVIAAMVEACAGARGEAAGLAEGPGIYLAGPGAGSVLVRPAASPAVSTSGNGSWLFPYVARLTVSQERAQVVSHEPRPVFLFRFDPGDAKVNSFGTIQTVAAQFPTEYSLVQFSQVRGARQFVIGRVQPFSGVAGVDPRKVLPFEVMDEGGGHFRVRPAVDLPPGQYGFVLMGETPRNRMVFRVYDFAVAAND